MWHRSGYWIYMRVCNKVKSFTSVAFNISKTEITICDMVSWLTLYHRNCKCYFICSFSSLTQIFFAGMTHLVWCPGFVLVSNLDIEVIVIYSLYTFTSVSPLLGKCMYTTYIAICIWLYHILPSTRLRSHFLSNWIYNSYNEN